MKKPAATAVIPTAVTPTLLRKWPLPQHDEGDDKEGRGRIFVVGGSAQIPGAILLASLRAGAGAGQLKIATARSVAAHVALAVPEAWVLPLPETSEGGFGPACADEIAENANAVLFGPGMMDPDATRCLLHAALPQIQKPTLVLDAAPLACLGDAPDLLHSLDGNVARDAPCGRDGGDAGARQSRDQGRPAGRRPGGRREVQGRGRHGGQQNLHRRPGQAGRP